MNFFHLLLQEKKQKRKDAIVYKGDGGERKQLLKKMKMKALLLGHVRGNMMNVRKTKNNHRQVRFVANLSLRKIHQGKHYHHYHQQQQDHQ